MLFWATCTFIIPSDKENGSRKNIQQSAWGMLTSYLVLSKLQCPQKQSVMHRQPLHEENEETLFIIIMKLESEREKRTLEDQDHLNESSRDRATLSGQK